MASFSRLQLAAALLEYDNDPDDPYAPKKSAYDSAIFSHLRRANGNIHSSKAGTKNQNLLGVALPSDGGLTVEDKDVSRRSKASIDVLHNPFGGDEEEEPEEELEVDLASWGLDSIIPEEKTSKKSKAVKGKAKSEIVMSSQMMNDPRSDTGRTPHSRTMSVPLAEFGEGGVFLEANKPNGGRRNTISSPMDLSELGILEKQVDPKRFSSHPIIENIPVRPPLHSLSSSFDKRDAVPFPTSGQSEVGVPSGSRPASRLDAFSDGQSEERNPFAIPPPPPSRASRFDPKTVAHTRTISNATRLSSGPRLAYLEEEEPQVEDGTRARSFAVDPNSNRDRRISTASFGTRAMLDDDQSAYGDAYGNRERRYSRLDLMRPKVLVMPSPLQNTTAVASAPKKTRDGFLDTSDGRPMPPGATSRMSMLGIPSVPVASNSFTPNPRLSLSASQLLFRNTLLVDGQRDVAYNDIDEKVGRAVEDGEQVKVELPSEPETPPIQAAPVEVSEPRTSRPPGKLFGRSLIDDLEARKAEMKGKARVFKGDQRPSMMDRGGLQRSSTLIDPTSLALPARPTSTRLDSSNTTNTDTVLVRRGSRGGAPLLAIDSDGNIAETGRPASKMMQTRSVFGVDTLWEREMAKLKEIEAQEKKDAEERRRREEEEETKKPSKKKKKGKGKGKDKEPTMGQDRSNEFSPSPVSLNPPSSVSPLKEEISPSLTLPTIPTVSSRRGVAPVPNDDDDSDNESSASEAVPRRSTVIQEGLADQWVSDDEKKPDLVPKIGLGISQKSLNLDDDSDEDVPLSQTLQRATQKLAVPRLQPEDDSDEDRPLSTLIMDKPKLNVPSVDFSDLSSKPATSPSNVKDDDDDDEPLGIRASRLPTGASQLSGLSSLSPGTANDDDDRPLSMHPGQMRKSQFQMFAQLQQQQQQQQLFQAQMAFNHPQSMMFMMQPPMAYASQPQLPMSVQEPNKFSSVDRWRHDVAIEGKP